MYRRQTQPAPARSVDFVRRQTTSLLNKLVGENFQSISDQIINITSQPIRADLYAGLFRVLMEQTSLDVRDEGTKNPEGRAIAGGQLVRKYLLKMLQEQFEQGWDPEDVEGPKKSKFTGLVRFISEVFKKQMLTERIMHECIKKLLANVENPHETENEALCILLESAGLLLDTPKARAHMDVYFSRIRELNRDVRLPMRHRFMLQDLIDLRSRQWWVARKRVMTIAAVHEAAAKEKALQEKESYNRQMSMSRGGSESRRGGDRGGLQEPSPDGGKNIGCGNTPRPPSEGGDLTNFGRMKSTSKGLPMTFGPSSVFLGKKDKTREYRPRGNSSQNMFSMLSQTPETAVDASKGTYPHHADLSSNLDRSRLLKCLPIPPGTILLLRYPRNAGGRLNRRSGGEAD
ncbi:armadillo-type protein [Mycena vulgaris]|nr:armadillo-type protein [Mycena vulgaris]